MKLNMDAEMIAAALGRHSRKSGGGFMAQCPAHDDHTPSLSIDDSDDGRILVRCMAGCEQATVIKALERRGLWGRRNCHPPAIPLRRHFSSVRWKPIIPVPPDAPPPPSTHYLYGKPSMNWEYRSANGNLLQMVYRFDGMEGKRVIPAVFAKKGSRQEWRWQGLPAPRPLYGLETLFGHPHVVVTEGEKAADALRRLFAGRIPVLTWPGGSNAVDKADWTPLGNRRVYVWPDADAAGTKAALAVIARLAEVNTKSADVLVPPKGVFKGWDAADAEHEGWTNSQTLEFLQSAIPTEEFKRYHGAKQEKPLPTCYDENGPWVEPDLEDGELRPTPYQLATSTSDLRNSDEKIEYIVDGLIPKHFITLLYAPSGLGKSTLATQCCQAVQDGVPFLDLETLKTPCFYLDYENPRSPIVERLKRIGGTEPFPFWHYNSEVPPPQFDDKKERRILLDIKPGTMVVIDTLKACNNLDENKANEMKPLFDFIKELRRRGLTILLLHHTTKGPDGTYRGSSVIQDQADHCISLTKVKVNGSNREMHEHGNTTTIYRLGVKGKTRANPFSSFLKFDKSTGLFVPTVDPALEPLNRISEVIARIAKLGESPNQIRIIAEMKTDPGEEISDRQVRALLTQGDGRFWKCDRGANNSKIYTLLPGFCSSRS